MGVFANGLEISGKAVGAKTIAAMPDVCFTPPENPATPPGVPVPYPSFGMAGDTDKGTGTVKISGEQVNLKNLSFLSKTTGTEAGVAAKKGIVSSKNTGKAYFISWSNDVKFEGEPVIRNTDMSTQNHGSDPGNAPPWIHMAGSNFADDGCAIFNIKPYNKLKCPKGYEKEHTVEAQFFTINGVRDKTLKCCEAYEERKAPCICLKAKWDDGDKGDPVFDRGGKAEDIDMNDTPKKGTAHYNKTADARNWLSGHPDGELGDFNDTCVKSTVDNARVSEKQKKQLTDCLKEANEDYQEKSMGKSNEDVRSQKKCHGSCPWAKEMAEIASKKKDDLNEIRVAAGKKKRGVRASNLKGLEPAAKCSRD